MALNQPDTLFSGIKADNYGRSVDECLDKERKNLDGSGGEFCESHWVKEILEKGSDDIVDLLPNDPFGMNINISATVAAITDWIKDFKKDFLLKSHGVEGDETERADDKVFAEVNFMWSTSSELESGAGDDYVVDKNAVGLDIGSKDRCYGERYMLEGNKEEFMYFGYEKYLTSNVVGNNKQKELVRDYNDDGGGAPPEALLYALGHLGVKDLLSVERVCKFLRDTVQNDPLLWRSIHINYPLHDKLTDEALLGLTNRAQGSLESLSLEVCFKVTDAGLRHVLQRNPRLTKLSVTGCSRLKMDGILRNLKAFKTLGAPGIKRLRIGGIPGATHQHLEDFELLLGTDKDKQPITSRPRYYRTGELYLSLDDPRPLDLETCPRCQKVGEVYDCTSESCRGKTQASASCRACTLCIARCIYCGRCLTNCDYEETFCFDLTCLRCLKEIFRYGDKMMLSPKHTCYHRQTSYHFFLCG